MGKIRLGSTELKKVRLGSTVVKKIRLGTTLIWTDFLARKMNKSGAQTISNLAWVNITGWAVDSSAPDTIITSDTLPLKANEAVIISGALDRGGTNSGNGMRIITTENVIIASKSNGGLITIDPFAYTPTIDTAIRVQGYSNSGLSGNPTIPGGPTSYLSISQPSP